MFLLFLVKCDKERLADPGKSKPEPAHSSGTVGFADDFAEASVVRRGSIRAKKGRASAFNVLLVPQRWALVPTIFQILSAVWLQCNADSMAIHDPFESLERLYVFFPKQCVHTEGFLL